MIKIGRRDLGILRFFSSLSLFLSLSRPWLESLKSKQLSVNLAFLADSRRKHEGKPLMMIPCSFQARLTNWSIWNFASERKREREREIESVREKERMICKKRNKHNCVSIRRANERFGQWDSERPWNENQRGRPSPIFGRSC